jgi:AraC-like DNA-binding protein
MGPGQGVVLTGGEPSSFGGPAQESVHLLRVPVRVLAPLTADIESAYGRTIPAQNRALRLLIGYLGVLDGIDGTSPRGLEPQVVTHIHDLMALAIGATRDAAELAKNRGASAARLCAIKQDIENCLDQPGLSVATIAARHGINPRWVQRLFESEGTTFTEYVVAQRLVRAYRLLTNPLYAGQKISTIAFDTGFGDVSNFNRAFRRRYGAAPSELRAVSRSTD